MKTHYLASYTHDGRTITFTACNPHRLCGRNRVTDKLADVTCGLCKRTPRFQADQQRQKELA